MAAVYALNPLSDRRWRQFIDEREDASIFHTPQWLEAIRKTYGYEPFVYTTTPPGRDLQNGIVVCRVRSWLTGKRLVSVPFADHCDVLAHTPSEHQAILSALRETVRTGAWKYLELRPRDPVIALSAHAFYECNSYVLHAINLRPSKDELFSNLHKDSNQRKIRRAEREGLSYEEGRSEELLAKFYELHLLTRRRHQLPPQPFVWFRNLAATMGDALSICMASREGQPIGSIITLRHRNALVYKYGASDAAYHNLGTMPLIFWRVICAAKSAGVEEFDLGRSSPDDKGLIVFKDRLGAQASTTSYLKHSLGSAPRLSTASPLVSRMKPLFARMPDRLLVATGRMFYRHIG